MSQRAKLIKSIVENPKDVRFDDACKVAGWLEFKLGVEGSHHAFSKAGEPDQLNFQNRGGKIKPYQAKQLISMIDKYWDFKKGGLKNG